MTEAIIRTAQRIILKALIAAVTAFFAAAVGAIMRGARGLLIAPGSRRTPGSAAAGSVSSGLNN